MKTLFKTILIYNLTFIIYNCQAQNIGINQTGANAHPSALLDLDANPTNNTGLLIPRLTTAERNAIASPALSLLIFNTTTNCFEAWMGSAWYTISCPLTCNPPSNPSPITGISCVVSGQTGINYSISSVVGATSYSWAVPAGYSITAGMGSNAITVTSGSVSGNVSVFASNGCGNSAITTISVQTSFLSCNAIKIANSSAPDGVYSIDPDGGGPLPCMPCQCDMTTDGGGWTLIANYSVPNFTTAADNVMNTFPLINNPTAPLGTDERGLGTPFYGRINGTNLTSYPFTEIRVDGERGLSTTATTIVEVPLKTFQAFGAPISDKCHWVPKLGSFGV